MTNFEHLMVKRLNSVMQFMYVLDTKPPCRDMIIDSSLDETTAFFACDSKGDRKYRETRDSYGTQHTNDCTYCALGTSIEDTSLLQVIHLWLKLPRLPANSFQSKQYSVK